MKPLLLLTLLALSTANALPAKRNHYQHEPYRLSQFITFNRGERINNAYCAREGFRGVWQCLFPWLTTNTK